MRGKWKTITLAMVAFALVTGCSGPPSVPMDYNAERPDNRAAEDVRNAMAELYGTPAEEWQTNVAEVTDDMNESHRMMAIMMLKGERMDSDLDNYREVFLVDVKSPDSAEITKVLVTVDENGQRKTIVPKNAEN